MDKKEFEKIGVSCNFTYGIVGKANKVFCCLKGDMPYNHGHRECDGRECIFQQIKVGLKNEE